MAFGKKDSKVKEQPKSRMNQADDEQLEGFSPDADAYEVPPPVHDGTHIVEVKLSETKQEIGEFVTEDEDGTEKKHFHLQLILTIIGKSDPEKGRIIFDTINTMPRRTAKGPTTAVATLLRQIGGKASGRPFTDITALKNLLGKSVPKRQVVTQWQTQYDKEQKAEAKKNGAKLVPRKGEASFPEVDGIHVPLSADSEGRPVRTAAVVVKYEDPS